MSLFGTGRREGIVAVCAIGLLTALVHVAAAWRLDELCEQAWVTAFAGAVGGMWTYRFLRVQGRSRYAAFLGGIAYGMSPLFSGLVGTPREQLAAAFVPLGLEAIGHCDRPTSRRTWLPWIGLSLALPFVVGVTVVATLATALGLGMLAVTILRSGRGDGRVPLLPVLLGLAIGAVAVVNLIWLDPLVGWLGAPRSPAIARVLAGETTPMVVVRVVGPFLVWFALFGILRRQRHVTTTLWLLLAIVGATPTVLLTIPNVAASMPNVMTTWAVPAMSWWLSVLAITVMGAAGLDDWLDQPLRRRGAHLWLLLVTLFCAPALPLAGAKVDPAHLVTVLGTFGVLAAVTLTWRRLGVLRFKNVLTTVALGAFAVPVLWREPDLAPDATPLAELAQPSWTRVVDQLTATPLHHFAGLLAAVATSLLFFLTLHFRRR
jgi:hypothetical protein